VRTAMPSRHRRRERHASQAQARQRLDNLERRAARLPGGFQQPNGSDVDGRLRGLEVRLREHDHQPSPEPTSPLARAEAISQRLAALGV